MKFNIGWGITNCCNMNCKFCYSKETRQLTKEITINDWIKFIDENYEKIDSINYGTGENVIDDDFFEFIEYVRHNYPKITQSLTTNGYLYEKVSLNKRFYNIYKECIDEVDVSLDFSAPEKHNYFRGQNKAYNWAINTLGMLKKDNKKATIVFVGIEDTMSKENIDGLFKIAKAYNALLRLNIYRPVSQDMTINERFILSYKTLIETLEYINNKYEVISINDILLGNMYAKDSNIEENTGINSIRILADGSICPSTYLISENYRNKFNIKQKNVLSTIKFDDFIEAPIPKECEKCEIKNSCRGGVFDRRLLWYNTLLKRDPYCPYENNDILNKEQIKILKKDRISVHDGYLPTIFFKS